MDCTVHGGSSQVSPSNGISTKPSPGLTANYRDLSSRGNTSGGSSTGKVALPQNMIRKCLVLPLYNTYSVRSYEWAFT